MIEEIASVWPSSQPLSPDRDTDFLQSLMRDPKFSKAKFLGDDESLTERIKQDFETVQSCGFSHVELSRPLSHANNALLEGKKTFDYLGSKYSIEFSAPKGFQDSPFNDDTIATADITLTNEIGETLFFSNLLPEMISRYGFYEGKGLHYRLDPERIIEFFHLAPHLEHTDRD